MVSVTPIEVDDELVGAVYKRLVTLGRASAAALQEDLGLDDSDSVARALDTLHLTGYADKIPATDNLWRAEAPEVAMAKVLSDVTERSTSLLHEASHAARLAGHLSSIHDAITRQQTEGSSQKITGRDPIGAQFGRQTESATESVMAIMQATPSDSDFASAVQDEERTLARGVRVQSIYPLKAMDHPSVRQYVDLCERYGSQVRFSSSTPFSLRIADRRIATIARIPEPGNEVEALVHRDPTTVLALVTMFEALWDAAQELPDAASPEQPTGKELEVLEYIRKGETQKKIARELKMDVKTLRVVRDSLLKRAGVRSELELGAVAARRGWIA